MICQQCGKEFEAKRADALYCSPRCRKAAFKCSPKEQIIVEKEQIKEIDALSVPDNGAEGTDNGTDKLSVPGGILDGIVRDDAFYANLTGEQAQELLKEACKKDPRINPKQLDWAAITGARLRRKGLYVSYKAPKDRSKEASALRERMEA